MKNVSELHEVLDEIIDGLMDESIKVPKAAEVSNAVGKRISLIGIQMKYHVIKEMARRKNSELILIESLEDKH